jgi:uncharacterized PurR-regulated membrane protein YhhQ (DUF165 family)
LGMPLGDVLPIIFISYSYKACFSLISTPVFYLMVFLTKIKNKPSFLIPSTNQN